MKQLMMAVMLLISMGVGAQTTVVGDKVVARKGIFLKDYWVNGIKRDTINFNDSDYVPTVRAVRDFVKGNGNNGSQNLQQVTNIGSTTTQDITANNFKATGLPEYENNAAALAAGLEINKFYRVPYNDGKYLLAVVGAAPTPTASSILTESGQPIQTESGQTIIIE